MLTYNQRRKLLGAANKIREGLVMLHDFHVSNEAEYDRLISALVDADLPPWSQILRYADAVAEFSIGGGVVRCSVQSPLNGPSSFHLPSQEGEQPMSKITAKDLLEEWHDNHSDSPYWIPAESKCDDCGEVLTDDERLKNLIDNEAQDGNAILCSICEEDNHDE